ncbi:carboxypeptidase-like regulatory domain-containing protein [Ichthyobacterium seriolicida]|uniref:TonB-dependent receptor n=1 Tax=Ichthyobacterium seriolicida TaxID=242600 RepID=A0A1J1DXJ0_9FLAO|nr:carboxypeptidase-like regulatory domain-containing protein [Ichthyobacterium seriolicida]BAV94578.1 hypothetical protein JBKA6_0565 [Ichthyobacterium seriolicida]
MTFKNIISCLLLSTSIYSQTRILKGHVYDKKNQEIGGATLVLYSDKDDIISYTTSDKKGSFEIKDSLKIEYRLVVRHVSFLEKTKVFSKKDLEKEEIIIDFILENNTLNLEEIVVTSDKKGTHTLDLSKLNIQESDDLKTILEKNPNLAIDDSGVIIYKGKNIDKILINNKEAFVNQNELALKSVKKRMIKNIQVIDDYKDDFYISFDEVGETVLNLNTKESFKNVFTGSVSANYGYHNKYQLKGDGFLFSENTNAFVTNNTNNIISTSISNIELGNIFGRHSSFSPYEIAELSKIISLQKQVKNYFFSISNLTLRNTMEKLRHSSVYYYIKPSKVKTIYENINTLENKALSKSYNEMTSNGNSVLGRTSIDYKLSRKIIASNLVGIYFADNNYDNNIKNTLFKNESFSDNYTEFYSSNRVFSIFNNSVLTMKTAKNIILKANVYMKMENDSMNNKYTIDDILSNNNQDFNFKRNIIEPSLSFNHKLNEDFEYSIVSDYTFSNEYLKEKINDNNSIKRRINNSSIGIKIWGEILENISYDASFSLARNTNKLSLDKENNSLFIPIQFYVKHEKGNHSIVCTFNRSESINNLESGINRTSSSNIILIGREDYPIEYSESNNGNIYYSYNNLFYGESFSIGSSYSKHKNYLSRTLLDIEENFFKFRLFTADSRSTYTVYSDFSKTLFQITYPVKLYLKINASSSFYPSMINEKKVSQNEVALYPKFKIETLSDHLINFKTSFGLSFGYNKLTRKTHDSYIYNRVIKSSFSILFKNENLNGKMTLLYNNRLINNKIYNTQEINVSLSYKIEKITFSISSRNFGQLFSIYDNFQYKSRLTISDGIDKVVINNKPLAYIIFGITYDF